MPFLTREKLDVFEKKVASTIEWVLEKGLLWLLILKEVKERPSHSYEIYKRIKEKYGINPHLMTVYATVWLMIASKFLESKTTSSKRITKVLNITPKGEEALKRGMESIERLYKLLHMPGSQ